MVSCTLKKPSLFIKGEGFFVVDYVDGNRIYLCNESRFIEIKGSRWEFKELEFDVESEEAYLSLLEGNV